MTLAVRGEVVEDRPALVLVSEQAYVTETPTGLWFRDDTPVELWGALVERLQRQQKLIEWALADAINFGEQAYGEDYAQWVDETGLSKRTLQNIARIGRAIEPARRRAEVSFSHHAEVVSLPVPEQERLLDAAEAAGMTRYELRDAVRERKEQIRGRTTDEPEQESAGVWTPTIYHLTDEARAALRSRLAEMGKRHAVGFEAGWVRCLAWLEAKDCFQEWPE